MGQRIARYTLASFWAKLFCERLLYHGRVCAQASLRLHWSLKKIVLLSICVFFDWQLRHFCCQRACDTFSFFCKYALACWVCIVLFFSVLLYLSG